MLPGGSKITPKWFPEVSRRSPKIEAATFFDPFLAFLERSWGALGALLAAPGALRGRSWSLRGHSWSPFWPPRGHFWELFEALLAAPWKNTKSYKKTSFPCIFWEWFSVFFMWRFLGLAGAGGATAHLEKPANGVEGVALFACRPFARGAKKRTKEDVKRRKTELENASKKERRKTSKHE